MRNLLAICVLFLGGCCLDNYLNLAPPVAPEPKGEEFKPDFNTTVDPTQISN